MSFLFLKKKKKLGSFHPITKLVNEIVEIFSKLGYVFFESSELDNPETFDLLNIPFDHPARSKKDTFFLNDNLFLRTHTSNGQIIAFKKFVNREMKLITAGKVYRHDEDDSTHTHQFFQLEIFCVQKEVSLLDLQKTIVFLLQGVFGKEVKFRFRPSYFPFTIPSIEVDLSCCFCLAKGCSVCKDTGWLELLGAGLIHPKVLSNCGFNNKKFRGFALGVGIERLLMIKYKIKDIRSFYSNDLRFLSQFI